MNKCVCRYVRNVLKMENYSTRELRGGAREPKRMEVWRKRRKKDHQQVTQV